MIARPTATQKIAIEAAIDTNRIGDATEYADRTLAIMERNGWITRHDTYTYRITPKAVRDLGKYTLAEKYLKEDLLATDPKAQRQADVIAQAREVGIHAFAMTGVIETVSISVEVLAELLAGRQTTAYAA
jgi:hypothetical protein